MLGVLPGAVQSRPSLQHLYLDSLRLLLPGCQEQGITQQYSREEGQSLNAPEKRQAKRGVLGQEAAVISDHHISTTDSGGVEAVTEALECDQCEYVGASEKGLKKAKEHQSTPEVPRSRDASSLPVRQSEIIDQGPWKEHAYLEAGLDECPVCHVKRPNSCDFWVDHPIVPKK